MFFKGKVKKVTPALDKNGNPRTYVTKNGEKFEVFSLDIDMVQTGSQYTEELVADYSKKVDENNPFGALPFQSLVESGEEVEIRGAFRRSEYNGRSYMYFSVFNVSQPAR